MITARKDADHTDWEFTDAQRNQLYDMLDNTVYTEEKKSHYEYLIKGEDLNQVEYEALKGQFLRDAKNPVTQGGNYKQGDIVKHLRKLR